MIENSRWGAAADRRQQQIPAEHPVTSQATGIDYSATPEGAFSFHLILFMIWIN